MNDNVKVTPEMLMKASRDTDAVRDGLAGVLSRLDARLQSRGAPWGADVTGDQFYKDSSGGPGYKSAMDNLTKGAGNLAKTFGNVSDTQADAARTLQKAEEASKQGFGA